MRIFGRLPEARGDHSFAETARPIFDGEPLPPGLRVLGGSASPVEIGAGGSPPRILFPPDGATFPLPSGGPPIELEAVGGLRPLAWAVNGAPLASHAGRRRARFRPDGIGFTEILVIDASGHRARVRVRLIEETL